MSLYYIFFQYNSTFLIFKSIANGFQLFIIFVYTMCNMPIINFPYFFDPMYYYYHQYMMPNEVFCKEEQISSKIIKKAELIDKQPKNKNKDEQWTIENIQKLTKSDTFNQKEGRNVISNILRSFLKFLTSKEAKNVFDRLYNQHQVKYLLKDIINWLEQKQINYRNYVRLQTIINIIKKDKEEKGKILAMFFLHYSKKYLRNHFLTSQRLNQNNKLTTLAKIRQIDEKILQIYK